MQEIKLGELGPNEVVIITSERPLSSTMASGIRAAWEAGMGRPNRMVLLDPGLKIAALHRCPSGLASYIECLGDA